MLGDYGLTTILGVFLSQCLSICLSSGRKGDGLVPRQRASLKGKDLSSHILDTIPCANGKAFEGEERGPLHMSNQQSM